MLRDVLQNMKVAETKPKSKKGMFSKASQEKSLFHQQMMSSDWIRKIIQSWSTDMSILTIILKEWAVFINGSIDQLMASDLETTCHLF